MQTAEFLRLIFPLEDANDPRKDDLIRFAVIDSDQRFPGTIHWRSRGTINALDETGISGLGFDSVGKDVYFSPHGFTRRGKDCGKDDAVDLLDVAWVELDDADIPPGTFKPEPSIVVSTSPGRFHLYWLLAEPLPARDVEKINYRLAYGHKLREDKGGWALAKWLRLPGSTSFKRQTPHPIVVQSFNAANKYTAADFDDLEAAPEIMLDTGKMPDPPNLEHLSSRLELEEQYSFTNELKDLLDRPREDRSAALWRIYHICYTLGMSEEDCFSLVYNSANDKFHSEWRYNSDEDLWKDIYRGYRIAHAPAETPVLTTLKKLRAQTGTPVTERRRLISEEVMKDLNTTGCLYWDTERHEALYYDGQHIIPMDPTNRKWKTLLNLRYWIVDGEPEFKVVNETLTAFVQDRGIPVVPKTSYFWSKQQGLLYVYNGEGMVYRLDGKTIEVVRNGTDGILFRDTLNMEPFTAMPGDASTPSLETAIFGIPNYDEQLARHTREQATALFRLWTYSLFFSEYMDAQPHLIIAGPTDSGKSLALQAVGELLLGSTSTVSAIPSDRDTFETAVSNAHHVFLDNVDTPNKWLEDALCEVATGIQFTRRKLYTTNDHVTFKVKCHLGMTTRNHWFTRSDVSTRLVVLYVDRRGEKISPTVLLDRIRNNRNQLWYELLQDLNKIVGVIKTWAPKQHDLRMAAYADFMLASAQALDLPEMGLLRTLEMNQKQTARDASILWSVLEQWVRQVWNNPQTNEPGFKNNGQWTTAAKLHAELRGLANTLGVLREYERQIPNARSLAQNLKELSKDMASVVQMDTKVGNPANLYKFVLADHVLPQSEMVEGTLIA
jgi:hypothetical protein